MQNDPNLPDFVKKEPRNIGPLWRPMEELQQKSNEICKGQGQEKFFQATYQELQDNMEEQPTLQKPPHL